MRRIGLAGLLTVSLILTPFTPEAQQAGKVYRVGYLTAGSVIANPRVLEAFRQGLRELGWVEGQNIIIDYRFAEGRLDRLPDLADELVRLKVDVIVAGPTPPAVAARNATRTIPILAGGGGGSPGTHSSRTTDDEFLQIAADPVEGQESFPI
jgi:ABC-type uncharacterized transport system substrate-binding protein